MTERHLQLCPEDPSGYGLHWRNLGDAPEVCRACGRGDVEAEGPGTHVSRAFGIKQGLGPHPKPQDRKQPDARVDTPPEPVTGAPAHLVQPSAGFQHPARDQIGTDRYPAEGRADTSRAAYESHAPKVRGRKRREVYVAIGKFGGATAEQIEEATGMSGNTVRPRLKELEDGLFIVKTAETRMTRAGRAAIVWQPVQHAGDWMPLDHID